MKKILLIIVVCLLLLTSCNSSDSNIISENHVDNFISIYNIIESDYQNEQFTLDSEGNQIYVDYLDELSKDITVLSNEEIDMVALLAEDINAYTKYHMFDDLGDKLYFIHVHELLGEKLGEVELCLK